MIETSPELLAFLTQIRRDEHAMRLETLRRLRDGDFAFALLWRETFHANGIDVRDDIKRYIKWARRWNHELVRMLRAKRVN